jgi:hypothetical protein
LLSVVAGIIIPKITGRYSIQRLALLCPTRGRPDRIREFIGSALTTATHPERVEILLWVDDDDSTASDYEKAVDDLKGEFGSSDISLRFGPSVGVPKAANNLYDDTTADIVMTSNDDQVFIDKGWDDRLDLEIAKYPDGIFCM